MEEEEGDILLRLLHRRPLRAAVAELDGGEGRHHGGLQPVDPALHLNRSCRFPSRVTIIEEKKIARRIME